jgi:mRNA interferase RelE/StbE/toxin YoeB
LQKDTNYELEISDDVDEIFTKLRKKNKKQIVIINKKILEILKNPEHYKPLRGEMYGARRVHIDKSFVLLFEIKDNKVRILDYGHHDDIY